MRRGQMQISGLTFLFTDWFYSVQTEPSLSPNITYQKVGDIGIFVDTLCPTCTLWGIIKTYFFYFSSAFFLESTLLAQPWTNQTPSLRIAWRKCQASQVNALEARGIHQCAEGHLNAQIWHSMQPSCHHSCWASMYWPYHVATHHLRIIAHPVLAQ